MQCKGVVPIAADHFFGAAGFIDGVENDTWNRGQGNADRSVLKSERNVLLVFVRTCIVQCITNVEDEPIEECFIGRLVQPPQAERAEAPTMRLERDALGGLPMVVADGSDWYDEPTGTPLMVKPQVGFTRHVLNRKL